MWRPFGTSSGLTSWLPPGLDSRQGGQGALRRESLAAQRPVSNSHSQSGAELEGHAPHLLYQRLQLSVHEAS